MGKRLEDFGRQYREELEKDPKSYKNIIKEIENLTYSSTGEKLSQADIRKLINYIKCGNANDSTHIELKNSANDYFLVAVYEMQKHFINENGDNKK